MALTKCSECGAEVSTKAAACPQCGAPVRRVHAWRLLVGIALASILLACAAIYLGSRLFSLLPRKTVAPTQARIDALATAPAGIITSTLATGTIVLSPSPATEASAAAMPTPTLTPIPTPTPTLTPTPMPATVKQDANGRSGPGTDFDVVATFRAGETVVLVGKDAGGVWYRLATGPWVFGELLSVSNPAVVPVVTVAPTVTPNVRATQTAEKQAAIEGYRKTAPHGIWCDTRNGISVCVGYIEYLYQVGYFTAGSGNKFVIVSITVYNDTTKAISVSPLYVTLVDLDTRTYTYSSVGFSYFSTPMQAVTVQPGDKAEGGILFAIKNDTGPAKIIYQGFLESAIVIDLTRRPDKAEQ